MPTLGADAARLALRSLGVQHRLTNRRDELLVQVLFDRVGRQMASRFELHRDRGDIVLLDHREARERAPEAINAFKDGRPAVLLDVGRLAAAPPPSMHDPLWDQQQDLQRQLAAIVRVRERLRAEVTPKTGFDSQFDSRMDAEPQADGALQRGQHQVLLLARAGRANPVLPALTAGYGPGKILLLDFAAGIVHIDPLADHGLRMARVLPHPRPADQPSTQAKTRPLDLVLWDLGVAGAGLPLLDSPADWWHVKLARTGHLPMAHFTHHPCFKALERLLDQGPSKPSDLRRRARSSVLELREFLQAALMLKLVGWQRR